MNNILAIVLNNFTNDYRVMKECGTISKLSCNVTVFALHEKGLATEEMQRNFKVKRFRLTTKKWSKKRLIQLIKYSECFLRMVASGLRSKPAVVHAHDLNALPIGYLISKLTRAKLIYDSHELWFDSSHKKTLPSYITKIGLFIERFIMKRANAVITVSDSIASYMAKNNDISKPFVIRNLPYKAVSNSSDDSLFVSLREKFKIPKDMAILIYQGGIAKNRGLETLVRAMKYVTSDAVLVFIGNGILKSKLRKMTVEENLINRIFFHDAVDPKILWEYTKEATIGVSPIVDSCLSYRWCLPNKMFEYIQAGLPVVATDLPEMAKIIDNYKVGEKFKDGDTKGLVKIINAIFANPGKLAHYRSSALKAAQELNWEKEEQKLIEIYNDLLKDAI